MSKFIKPSQFNAPKISYGSKPRFSGDRTHKDVLDEARSFGIPTIFIGIPVHDGRFHSSMAMSLLTLSRARRPDGRPKYCLNFVRTSSGGITKARNDLANKFIESGEDYLLYIDSDIQHGDQHLDKMLAANVDIIGAMYAHKKADLSWSLNGKPDGITNGDLQEVCGVGFGFMLHKRCVYEKMMEKMPELRFMETWNEGTKRWKYGFFQERIVMDKESINGDIPQWYTEDWFFLWNARKLGFKVWTDKSFFLPHHDGGSQWPNEKVQSAAEALMVYASGANDGGELARKTMEESLPGWANNISTFDPDGNLVISKSR